MRLWITKLFVKFPRDSLKRKIPEEGIFSPVLRFFLNYVYYLLRNAWFYYKVKRVTKN